MEKLLDPDNQQVYNVNYDTEGHVSTLDDGRTLTSVTAGVGRAKEVYDTSGAMTKFYYDALGNLL